MISYESMRCKHGFPLRLVLHRASVVDQSQALLLFSYEVQNEARTLGNIWDSSLPSMVDVPKTH